MSLRLNFDGLGRTEFEVEQNRLQVERKRVMDSLHQGVLEDCAKWRSAVMVIEFTKESASKALKLLKLLRGKESHLAEVRAFLEAVERVLPSEDDYKKKAKDQSTSKQERRKKLLKGRK